VPDGVEEVVATLRADDEPATTAEGVKEHVAPLGQPDATDNVTVPEQPFNADTEIVEFACSPGAIVAVDGVAEREKSGLELQLLDLKEPMRVYQP